MALYRHIILSLAVASAALPPTAAAQRLAVQANRWNLDYGDIGCSLARRLAGPQSPILSFSSFLGRNEPEIILMNDGSEALPSLPNTVEVVLMPGSHVERGIPRSQRGPVGRVIYIQGLGEDFIDRVAEARSIRFQARGQRVIEFALPQAGAAVTALKACNDDLLRSWGVDTTIPISRRARYRSGSINDLDYPMSSIRGREAGAVVARFLVNTDGRVQDCAIAVSSSYRTLDTRTCQLITDRFRYQPAVDDQGRPVTGLQVQTVRWLLPGG